MSPTTVDEAADQHADHDPGAARAALDALAGELTRRGFQAQLKVPHETLAYLVVRNPEAKVMTEIVYARDGAFWYSWWERIAGYAEAGRAAAILIHVLRAADT
jgi:hypothetical protein